MWPILLLIIRIRTILRSLFLVLRLNVVSGVLHASVGLVGVATAGVNRGRHRLIIELFAPMVKTYGFSFVFPVLALFLSGYLSLLLCASCRFSTTILRWCLIILINSWRSSSISGIICQIIGGRPTIALFRGIIILVMVVIFLLE